MRLTTTRAWILAGSFLAGLSGCALFFHPDDYGDGKGGGGLGRCPIVIENTRVIGKDIAGGAEITVTPATPAGLDALRKETRERAQNFTPGAVKGGASAPSASAAVAPAPPKK